MSYGCGRVVEQDTQNATVRFHIFYLRACYSREVPLVEAALSPMIQLPSACNLKA